MATYEIFNALNVNYLSIWHLVEYIEKYATIEQYKNLAVALYSKGSM